MATGIIEHLAKKLILQRYTPSYGSAISGGASRRLFPADAGYTIPTGYYPVGITYINTGNAGIVLNYLNLQNNSDQSTDYFISLKNVTSSSVSSTNAIIDVLFAPEWMVKLINADEPVHPSGDIMSEPVFKIANFTGEYSSLASGNGSKSFTRSELNFFVPEGYEIFSLRNVCAGEYRVSLANFDPFSPDRMLSVRNTYTSALSGTAEMGVVFINRKFMLPDTRKGLIIRCNIPTVYDDVNDRYEIMGRYISPTFYKTVTLNSSIFPTDPEIINTPLDFYLWHLDSATELYTKVYPKKVEIVSGEEYINFTSASAHRFVIPEDWTDRQIILNFTFD